MLLEKIKYNTLTVDGASENANHFKTKISGLYSSEPTSKETMDAIAEKIDIDVLKYCSSKVNETENYVHCHVISKDDVKLTKMAVFIQKALFTVLLYYWNT